MLSLPKQYNPAEYEAEVYRKWEESGAFTPPKNGNNPYVIMLPPPNITGTLHMGHALQDTIMDILMRYNRMLGRPALWLPGTDHAAIATNKVLEEQLHQEGKTRYDIGREEFMKRADEWYDKTGKAIINQMKRLGASCDWSRERFTMDTKYVQAVNKAFIHYYAKGLIYRGRRLVNWDPKSQTTVSDIEIDWHEETAPYYTFQYGHFQISTARPETKFGDKYVVMHPDDKRYAQYKHGDTFTCEWINGPVNATVIKDESIDPSFGTGVMTITPWHDATDFDIAERHNLDREQIIDFNGKLMPIAAEFAGMDIEEARPKIVAKLAKKGLLVHVNANYVHNVARNDRGKGLIEPQISRQWFLNMQKLKDETIAVVEDDLIRFYGPRWKKHFLDWMHNIRDWNINRQIWLGHRLPVWWKKDTHGTDHEEGNFIVAEDKPAGDYEQDPDVLDTWFSAALWPFATLGWPDAADDLHRFYPTSVLVTARDILYLWVARMIFSGLELLKGEEYQRPQIEQRIPFKDVFIHPTVLDKNGRRMSKSLGTGVDPLKLINKYGSDATRFGLMYQMSYDNQAIKFDENAIVSARNFANKIWNLARFLQNLPSRDEATIFDQWINRRCDAVIKQTGELIDQYRFGEAARLIYDFIWKDYADWYVEVLKIKGSTANARSVFTKILSLLHPFVPHITEVLWQQFGNKDMLITSPWPEAKTKPDQKADKKITRFQNIVAAVRSARALFGISPSVTIDLYVSDAIMPEILSSLAKVSLLKKARENMTKLPLAGGETIAIASDELTDDVIRQARQKLLQETTKLEQFVKRQSESLTQMKGKAPKEIVTAKKRLIADSQAKLKEMIVSKALLQ
ncbi:MAG: valine--tRNA ligase [bacterium]|nr:valine--tRNA ligase [bacterium]MDZ4346131.1 valine--tRNA ligase [Candidatus Binatia bacterium]